MPFVRRHWPAIVIVCLFILLGAVYSVVDPVFEASDELNHYPVVQSIAMGHGLPVQKPGEKTLWGQEGSQPPLYYMLAAALTSWIDTGDLPDLLYLNPHAQRGVPLAHDNKNMIVHTEREHFPWHGTALAVHLIRLLSVLLGAGTVLCTYILASDLFPGRRVLAYGAMALTAFIPMFLFISGSVNNDNLVIFLSSLALVLLVRILLSGASPRRLVVLGITIGLACLSKLSALGLAPIAALALVLDQAADVRLLLPGAPFVTVGSRTGRRWGRALRRWLLNCVWAFVPAVLVADWWYLRNWQLYGDPTGLNAMLAIAGTRPVRPSLLDLLDEFQGFRINFWGLFGGVNVLMRPGWVYPALDILTLLAVAGLFVAGWRAWRGRRDSAGEGGDGAPAANQFAIRRGWALLLLAAWIALEFLALIRWTMSTAASQGRLMFPAISAICLFMVLGWTSLLSIGVRAGWKTRRGLAIWLPLGLLFLLAASSPFAAIRPAYQRPPVLTLSDVPATARPYNVDYGGVARLLAYEIGRNPVRPGDDLPVTLYWQALAPTGEDFSVYLQAFGWQQPLAQVDSYPAGGAYPTSMWSPGQVIRDTFHLAVSDTAKGPAPAWLAAGLYRFDTMEKLPAVDKEGQKVVFPMLGKLRLETPGVTWRPAHALDASLENRVRLTGYDLGNQPLRPGAEVPLTLYWQVTGALDRDYSVFVHVVDAGDKIVAQADAWPLQGFYPTSRWESGEILNDTHRLSVPADLQPGAYRILVGLYDPVSGQRLSVLDSAGNPAGTEVLVTTLQAESP